MILVILYILTSLVIIFDVIVGIILVRRLKELNLYKKSKLRKVIEQKAQEQLINNW